MEGSGRLRLLSFNVNGLRACLQRSGRKVTLADFLEELGAGGQAAAPA